MTSLLIQLDRPIDSKPLESVDDLRSQILPIGDAVGKGEIFNWQQTANPHILYARPYKNSIRIVGITPDASDAIGDAVSILKGIGEMIFGGQRYKIIDVSIYNDVYLPRSAQKPITYKTVSPILFFTGNRRKLYEGILKTHGEFGAKENPKTVEYLKSYSIELIKEDIKNKLKDYIGERNYSFVDKIDLQWEEFSITHVPYHKDEKLTVGIKGKLVSNFYLPPFLGNKTGKGFGEMIITKEEKRHAA